MPFPPEVGRLSGAPAFTDLLFAAAFLRAAANLGLSQHAVLIGAAAGYLSLWSIYWLYKIIRGGEGFGYGDFKLLAALGAWFGWKMLLPIILFASLVGSVFGVYILYRQRKGLQTHIPFGPYLAVAGWLFLLVGHGAVDRYLSLYPRH